MTSAPTGGEGVAQNLTKTDMGEGGSSLILTSYFGTPMTGHLKTTQVPPLWIALGPQDEII